VAWKIRGMGFRSRVVFAALHASAHVADAHKGAVLPEGRVVVLAVPLAALAYYYFVVYRRRDR
jgi:hypothetical protein